MTQRDIAEQLKADKGGKMLGFLRNWSAKSVKDHTGGHRLAEPLPGAGLPFRFYGRHPHRVKEDQRYVTKVADVVLGIRMDRKNILGVCIGEHESSEFWRP